MGDIKMNHQVIGCNGEDTLNPAQDGDRLMKLPVLSNASNVSVMTVLPGVSQY